MNADHQDALNLYATKLLGAETAEWRCTGCDPDGLDLAGGANALRLNFPERVTDAGGLRKMLVKLAGEARANG
jgi:putative heme iron utilization protein